MLSRREDVIPLMKLSFNLLITPVVGLASFVFWYRQETIELLYHSHGFSFQFQCGAIRRIMNKVSSVRTSPVSIPVWCD